MNYFGNCAANERCGSRKGKKRNAEKAKQPQRGLGVAQLEKIRLHNQLGFHHPNSTIIQPQMGMGEVERSSMAYIQAQPSRWDASNAVLIEAEQYAKLGTTMHHYQLQLEESMRTKNRSDCMGSTSHKTDSNGSQELDLELRLSL